MFVVWASIHTRLHGGCILQFAPLKSASIEIFSFLLSAYSDIADTRVLVPFTIHHCVTFPFSHRNFCVHFVLHPRGTHNTNCSQNSITKIVQFHSASSEILFVPSIMSSFRIEQFVCHRTQCNDSFALAQTENKRISIDWMNASRNYL